VFSGLPNGTSWKVEETDADKNGYVTSVSNTSTGTIAADKTVSGTISAAASSADFTNTKNTTSIEAQKEWKKDASTALAWPSDVQSVTVGLKAKIGDGEATLISAITDTEIKSQFSFDLEKTISSAAEKAVWTSLPTRVRIPAEEADPANNVEAVAEHWEDVTYSVEETKVTLTNGTELTEDALTAAYANTVAGDAETGYTITNIPQPETQFSFTKQWRDGSSTNDQTWPQRDKVGAASGEKEYIPITVHLMRKLNDASDGEIVDTTFNEDLANTYVISPSSLSGWTLNEAPNPPYVFTKTGLQKSGTITVTAQDEGGPKPYKGEYIYYLTEEQVDGYNAPVYLERLGGTLEDTDTKRDSITNGGAVRNTFNVSFELPSTGGPGTTLFYVLGSILTLLAAVLLITKKRTEGQGIE